MTMIENPMMAPTLPRRLACFIYEGVLLFGVVMTAGYLYSSLTQQRHALQGQHGLQAFLFIVLGIYFIWFWSHSGQTVAMKTWHIRLVGLDGAPVNEYKAAIRYLLSWLWFLPSLAIIYFTGLQGLGWVFSAMTTGIMVFAALSYLHPSRQYPHDILCRTRLVTHRPTARNL